MSEHIAEILVVEDEVPMQRFICSLLSSHGYTTRVASTGEEAIRMATQFTPEVILLDLGLPDMDGHQVISSLRDWTQLPIIVLSVHSEETQKIEALDGGADDYLTKPFGSGELLARLRVALRHSAHREHLDENPILVTGDLSLHLAEHRAYFQDESLQLTATEYNLLRLLFQHLGKVLTYRFILREVWGPGYVDRKHYVRIYMARLREKLGDDPTQQDYLVTETGVGYRLRDRE